MPSALYEHSSAAYNGYIYVTGGNYDTAADSTSTVLYAPINGSSASLTLTNTFGMSVSYCLTSGVLRREASGAACTSSSDAITDSTVTVTSAAFTRLENTNMVLGKTIVSIKVDLTVSYAGTGPEEQYSEEKITTVALRN